MLTENEQGEQISFFDPEFAYLRTSKDCLVQTTVKTSESSLKNSPKLPTVIPQFLDCRPDKLGLTREPFWEVEGIALGLLLGDYTTPNFGVSPNVAVACRLLSILEVNPPPKYFLSPKACQGILNRAKKDDKGIPPILEQALKEQIASPLKFGGGIEVDSNGKKAGKGALIQENLSGTLGVSQDQTLFTKDNFSQYSESEVFAPLKTSGGDIGGERNPCETVGALQARDYKGVGNQYVKEGKIIIQRNGRTDLFSE